MTADGGGGGVNWKILSVTRSVISAPHTHVCVWRACKYVYVVWRARKSVCVCVNVYRRALCVYVRVYVLRACECV